MTSCCTAEGTTSSHLWCNMMEDNVIKRIYIYICMYVWLGHFAVQQKLTGHCKSTIIEKKSFKKNTPVIYAYLCVFMHKKNV